MTSANQSTGQSRWGRPGAIEWAALFVVIAIGSARIAMTYPVLNQTYDEPFHIVRGYQWWKGLSYRHALHPPLAPIVVGIGPVLSSVEVRLTGDKLTDGNTILYAGDYWQVLTRARMGNLLFFAGAICGAWLVGRDACGPVCGWVSAWILASTPPVLGHAGLATTDMAITATLIWAVWAQRRWLNRATWTNCGLMGLTWGLALLSKHSAALFLLVCGLAECWEARGGGQGISAPRPSLRRLGAALAVAGYVVWSGFGYSVGSIPASDGTAVAAGGRAILVPAPEYFRGLLDLASKNQRGHAPFFWGSNRSPDGHWAFFPMVLAIKTPLPFLALCVFGVFIALWSPEGRALRAPALATIVLIVAVALSSRINLGVRHLLPLYPMLSLCGGMAFLWFWSAGQLAGNNECHPRVLHIQRGAVGSISRVIAAGLLAAGWAASLMHPDNLSYFNLLAGRHPEEIVVDSDLDWGQDLARLRRELTARRIERSSLAYFGTAQPARHGFSGEQLLPVTPTSTGWVAISVTLLMSDSRYAWLRRHQPVARVGKSILLYYLDFDKVAPIAREPAVERRLGTTG